MSDASGWEGLDTEVAGIRTAVSNLGETSDFTQLARYVYNRMAAYVGADHEGVCVQLLEAAFDAIDWQSTGEDAEARDVVDELGLTAVALGAAKEIERRLREHREAEPEVPAYYDARVCVCGEDASSHVSLVGSCEGFDPGPEAIREEPREGEDTR